MVNYLKVVFGGPFGWPVSAVSHVTVLSLSSIFPYVVTDGLWVMLLLFLKALSRVTNNL